MKKPNFKKVTGSAVLSKIAVPIGCAALGTVVGAAAGKTFNLGVGVVLAGLGLAMDEPNMIYAGVGAAVTTPPAATATTTAGLDGLDGFADYFAGAKNRAMGQAKSLLSNAKLDVIADKIPVSGLAGLGYAEAYQDGHNQGYIEGVYDAVDEQNEMAGLSGLSREATLLQAGGATGGERMSPEAMLLRQASA